MAVISFQPNNKLFAKQRYSGAAFACALVLSLCLMIADFRYQSLGLVRRDISVIVSPMQFAVDYPMRIFGWVHSLFSSKKKLIDENMRLRYTQTILEAQLQKYLSLRNENSQLKQLLSTSTSIHIRTMAAQILAVETNRARQVLFLDKGTRNGVFVGQPVLDAKGVMGQVIDVGIMTSTVLLISDSKCAVPVRNDRTDERAILVGTNNLSQLSLINLPKTSSIAKGDLLVTSGLGRRYPEGYPVGRVEAVKNLPGEDFIKVSVSPIALLNRSRLVLLIWPEDEHQELMAQLRERLKVLEGIA